MGLKLKSILVYILTAFALSVKSQDTIRLYRKPKVILKSWHPEFQSFPTLKIGESKMLFTIIPDFKDLPIRNNDINIQSANGQVEIKETEKPNQYLVTVKKVESTFIELELWMDIENKTILIKQNKHWINITKVYPFNDNRILLQKIKLNIKR